MLSSNDRPEYDANVLVPAPVSTLAYEYDANVLASGPPFTLKGHTTNYQQVRLEPPRRDDLESGVFKSSSRHASTPDGSKDAVELKGATIPKPTLGKTPFYRSKKGIIVFVIIGIVILAAVIGGAVGGSTSRNHHPNVQDSGYGNQGSSSGSEGGGTTSESATTSGTFGTTTQTLTTFFIPISAN